MTKEQFFHMLDLHKGEDWLDGSGQSDLNICEDLVHIEPMCYNDCPEILAVWMGEWRASQVA